MIFHTPDTSQERLAQCFKRAVTMPALKSDVLTTDHPLAAMWANVCMFMDTAVGETDADRLEGRVHDIVLLDYVAMRIEEFSAAHLLADDAGVRALLAQWRERLGFVPVPALQWFKRRKAA
jgi:hypothetical protein